jgi:endonuclease/exonuclease/phosphatase family metal-dependent hydrolase
LVVAPLVAALAAACVSSHDIVPAPSMARACPDTVGSGVAWYFPARSGDNDQLERWCLAVGPVVADTLPAANFGELDAGDSLSVAVWNTDAGAGDLLAFLEREVGLQCAAEASTLRAGAPHAVILIQEALRRSNDIPDVPKSRVTPPPVKEESRPTPRLDVVEVAERCGLSLLYAPAARNDWRPRDGKREDKGNAILATVPLSDPIVMELPFEAARRVVPLVTVRSAAGDSLRVATVHLITTPPPARALLTGGSSRQRQALGLLRGLEVIERDRGGNTPADAGEQDRRSWAMTTIIAGDLNTWSNRETALRDLRAQFPESPAPLAEPTRGPFPTDHLLVRLGAGTHARLRDGSYRRVDDPYYSDHHPIVAVLLFRGR